MDPAIESDFDTGYHVYHDHSPPAAWTEYPGIVATAYGKGGVVYLPVPFFGAYLKSKSPFLKALFRMLVTERLGISNRVRIEAPVSVKAALMQDNEGWLLHLSHVQMQTDSMYLDAFTRPECVKVRVNPGWEVKGAALCLAGTVLDMTRDGEWTVIEAPCPKDHEIVRIRR
jgi:hypothetical protein